ncbi:hypothetical protein B0H34DRAFT_250896 [Crassisporium funariophilum]|nr:hypothetical protein B0H34DRAFT_250896 [Crassisporium funariophilum]
MPFHESPSRLLIGLFDPNEFKPPAINTVCVPAGREPEHPSVSHLMWDGEDCALRLPPIGTSVKGLKHRSGEPPLPPMRSLFYPTSLADSDPNAVTSKKSSVGPRGIKRLRTSGESFDLQDYSHVVKIKTKVNGERHTSIEDPATRPVFLESGSDSNTKRNSKATPEIKDDRCRNQSVEVPMAARKAAEKPEPKTECQWESFGRKCDFRAVSSSVKRHVKAVHLNLRPHRCSYGDCKKEFAQKFSLNIHVNSIHTGEKPLVCTHCDIRFSDPARRNKHVHRSHPEVNIKKRQKRNQRYSTSQQAKSSS